MTTETDSTDRTLSTPHALVCGASAGIGRAAAPALAGLGAEVTALGAVPLHRPRPVNVTW